MCFKFSGKTVYQNNNWAYLRALSERLVMEVHEARSRCFSFGQNLLRLLHVLQKNNTVIKVYYDTLDTLTALLHGLLLYLSVILVQPFRLSTSMFLQFCEKVLKREREKKRNTCVISVILQFSHCLPSGSALVGEFQSGEVLNKLTSGHCHPHPGNPAGSAS